MTHQHCDMDPIECNHEALVGEYEERGRRIADLEARLAHAFHDLVFVREEARVATGILRKLLEAHVIAPPYFLDGDWCIEDGSDGCRTAIVADAEAALLDTLTKETTH